MLAKLSVSAGGLFHGHVSVRDPHNSAGPWSSAARSHRRSQVLYDPGMAQARRAKGKHMKLPLLGYRWSQITVGGGRCPQTFVCETLMQKSHFPGLSDNHISLLRGTFPGYLRVHILKDILIGSAVSAIDKQTRRGQTALQVSHAVSAGITCSFCSVMSCNHLVRFLLQYMFYYFACFLCFFLSLFCVRVRVYVCLCFCRPYLSSCRCFVAVLSS